MKTLYPVLFAVVLLTIGCSGRNDITGSSPIATGLSGPASTADDTPTDLSRYDEPNDAPRGWTFVSQGDQHANGAQSFFASWTPIRTKNGLVVKYETGFETYASDNQWKPLPSIFTNNPTKFQVVMPAGIRFRVRTRAIFGNEHQGAWTAFIERTNGWPERSPEPSRECFWEGFGGLYTLVWG